MDLIDWLPIYPEFDADIRTILGSVASSEYPSGYDIYRKKEFYDYKLDKEEDPPIEPELLYKHQVIIGRFLSSHTPYRGLLLMHEPGTGKTCSSIAAIEQIKKEKTSIKKALILVKNDGLIKNYQKELVKCAGYELSDSGRIKKDVFDFYEFQTFERFIDTISKALKGKLSFSNLIQTYNNRVIVIDEIHNLRNTGKDSMYQSIYQFLIALTNVKIILMSGTPMTDKPEEIADIMNLILPVERQLPIKSDFRDEFLTLLKQDDEDQEEEEDEEEDEDQEEDDEEDDDEEEEEEEDKNGAYILSDLKKIEKLKSYFHGRVSVLKTMKSNVKRQYIGNLNLVNFKLYGVELSEHQKKSYKLAYDLDKGKIMGKGKGVYNNTKQCMAFAFPDGSYGQEGFNKYVNVNIGNVTTTMQPFKLRKDIPNNLYSNIVDDTNKDQKKMLQNVAKFSSKYAECIKQIIENGRSNHFVYMEFASGSGAILFARILELFGFYDFLYHSTGKNRYALATSSTSSHIQKMIEAYNQPRNKHGDYLKVIIGTGIISESYTLKNVQHIHIVVPDWNFGVTDQAIARGIRLGSHKDLVDEGVDVNVKIYMYCSTLVDPSVQDKYPEQESTDLYMYKKSQSKDKAIKSIEHAMKEASVDCSLNKERNQIPLDLHLDNQRICEYKSCAYKCDGINEDMYLHPKIDKSTYNLFYDEKDVDSIITDLKILFYTKTKIKLDRLFKMFNKDKVVIVKAIDKMVVNNVTIKDKLGYSCVVRYDNDYVYLTYNLNKNTNFFDNYYVEHFPLQEYSDHKKEIDYIYYENLPQLISAIRDETDDTKKRKLFNTLPITIQEILLEISILLSRDGLVPPEDTTSFIKRTLSNFWTSFEDGTIVITLIEDRLRCLKTDSTEWDDCDIKYQRKIDEKNESVKDQLLKNDTGYYGIIDMNDDFYITAVKKEDVKDNRKKTTGKKCSSWTFPDLLRVVDTIKLDFVDTDEIKDQTSSFLDELYKNSEKRNVNTTFTNDVFKNKTVQDKKRILSWASNQKGDICASIKEWFVSKKLVERVSEKTDVKLKDDKKDKEDKKDKKNKDDKKMT
jgi:hypothetical protein